MNPENADHHSTPDPHPNSPGLVLKELRVSNAVMITLITVMGSIGTAIITHILRNL